MIAAGIAEFREALPEGGRLLGLDVGTKTIGTALCDAQWTFASPAELVKRTDERLYEAKDAGRNCVRA